MFSTMINFTILGLLRRLHKLQMQVDLESTSDATGIMYPWHQLHKKKIGINDKNPYSVSSVTNDQIEEAIKSSLERAKVMMDDLGMKNLLVQTKNWDKPLGGASDADVDIKDIIEDADDEAFTIAGDHVSSNVVSELDDEECSAIIENLSHLEEKKIIDETIKEKITYLCRNNTSHSDGKTLIPLYRVGDQNDASVKRKQSNNFLEVQHKGEKIFIRKSTLVWMFQEGERVSTDRLFRVRVKQPYSTSLQQISSKCDNSSLPHVQEFVELGDICVFQENITPKEWSIGRITQFANYKESLKSNKQYKSSKALVQSNVGVLCTWFEHYKEDDLKFHYTKERSLEYILISEAYVCTLTQGCFQEVIGTKLIDSEIRSVTEVSVLNTATQFTLHDEVVSYINAKIAGLLSLVKAKTTKITTTKSKIVNTKNNESDSKNGWLMTEFI